MFTWGWHKFFDRVAGVLQGDTLAQYLFIICLDYVLWMSLDLIKENGFPLKNARSRLYSPKTMTDTDYEDNLVLLANTLAQAESYYMTWRKQQKALATIWMQIK